VDARDSRGAKPISLCGLAVRRRETMQLDDLLLVNAIPELTANRNAFAGSFVEPSRGRHDRSRNWNDAAHLLRTPSSPSKPRSLAASLRICSTAACTSYVQVVDRELCEPHPSRRRRGHAGALDERDGWSESGREQVRHDQHHELLGHAERRRHSRDGQRDLLDVTGTRRFSCYQGRVLAQRAHLRPFSVARLAARL
jgi:hypothetical protein